jgi:hypothetical protein
MFLPSHFYSNTNTIQDTSKSFDSVAYQYDDLLMQTIRNADFTSSEGFENGLEFSHVACAPEILRTTDYIKVSEFKPTLTGKSSTIFINDMTPPITQ